MWRSPVLRPVVVRSTTTIPLAFQPMRPPLTFSRPWCTAFSTLKTVLLGMAAP